MVNLTTWESSQVLITEALGVQKTRSLRYVQTARAWLTKLQREKKPPLRIRPEAIYATLWRRIRLYSASALK